MRGEKCTLIVVDWGTRSVSNTNLISAIFRRTWETQILYGVPPGVFWVKQKQTQTKLTRTAQVTPGIFVSNFFKIVEVVWTTFLFLFLVREIVRPQLMGLGMDRGRGDVQNGWYQSQQDDRNSSLTASFHFNLGQNDSPFWLKRRPILPNMTRKRESFWVTKPLLRSTGILSAFLDQNDSPRTISEDIPKTYQCYPGWR